MKVIKPPQPIRLYREEPSFFLAGSIEMGTAVDWQTYLTSRLDVWFKDVGVVLNPRRDEWDSSWEQSMEHDKFREQVRWNLKH